MVTMIHNSTWRPSSTRHHQHVARLLCYCAVLPERGKIRHDDTDDDDAFY
jgi:hypothetical protein